MHERDAHAAAIERGAGEGPARFGGRMPETVERHVGRERHAGPRRVRKHAYVRRQVVARIERARRERIVIAGRDEHPFAEARERGKEKTRGRRTSAFAFVEVAADGKHVGIALEREVDDALERVGEGGATGTAAAHVGEDRF